MPPDERHSAELERALDRALARINRYALALHFYADETNWDSKVIRTAKNTEGYVTGQECESGPAWDRGARARAALTDGPDA